MKVEGAPKGSWTSLAEAPHELGFLLVSNADAAALRPAQGERAFREALAANAPLSTPAPTGPPLPDGGGAGTR